MWKLGSVQITPNEFENATLLQGLGLLSTLIRHKNGAFAKTLFNPEEFKNPGFSFFENDDVTIIT